MKRALVVSLLLVAACGGSSLHSTEPRAAGEPQTIEEAQDQIADAQARLSGRSAGAQGAPPADESRSLDVDKDLRTPAEAPKSVASNPCETPCQAFASMKRAVEALCRMAGETDERCLKARQTLETSTARVSTCLCR